MASDIKLVVYSSAVTLMHGPINIRRSTIDYAKRLLWCVCVCVCVYMCIYDPNCKTVFITNVPYCISQACSLITYISVHVNGT